MKITPKIALSWRKFICVTQKKLYLQKLLIPKYKRLMIIRLFIEALFKILSKAAIGCYQNESKEITDIKKELFQETNSGNDKSNLLQDRKAIEKDVRDAWTKIKLSHE